MVRGKMKYVCESSLDIVFFIDVGDAVDGLCFCKEGYFKVICRII